MPCAVDAPGGPPEPKPKLESEEQVAMSQISQSHLLPVFARAEIAFERGEGVWLHATNGERYLDFGSGVAVNGLGHCHPHLVKAMTEQLSKVWHVSNL